MVKREKNKTAKFTCDAPGESFQIDIGINDEESIKNLANKCFERPCKAMPVEKEEEFRFLDGQMTSDDIEEIYQTIPHSERLIFHFEVNLWKDFRYFEQQSASGLTKESFESLMDSLDYLKSLDVSLKSICRMYNKSLDMIYQVAGGYGKDRLEANDIVIGHSRKESYINGLNNFIQERQGEYGCKISYYSDEFYRQVVSRQAYMLIKMPENIISVNPLNFITVLLILNSDYISPLAKLELVDLYYFNSISHELIHKTTLDWGTIFVRTHELKESGKIQYDILSDMLSEIIVDTLLFDLIRKKISEIDTDNIHYLILQDYLSSEELNKNIGFSKMLRLAAIPRENKLLPFTNIVIALFDNNFDKIQEFCQGFSGIGVYAKSLQLSQSFLKIFLRNKFLIIYDSIKNNYEKQGVNFIEKDKVNWGELIQEFYNNYTELLQDKPINYEMFHLLVFEGFLENPLLELIEGTLKRLHLTALLFIDIIVKYLVKSEEDREKFIRSYSRVIETKFWYKNLHLNNLLETKEDRETGSIQTLIMPEQEYYKLPEEEIRREREKEVVINCPPTIGLEETSKEIWERFFEKDSLKK